MYTDAPGFDEPRLNDKSDAPQRHDRAVNLREWWEDGRMKDESQIVRTRKSRDRDQGSADGKPSVLAPRQVVFRCHVRRPNSTLLPVERGG